MCAQRGPAWRHLSGSGVSCWRDRSGKRKDRSRVQVSVLDCFNEGLSSSAIDDTYKRGTQLRRKQSVRPHPPIGPDRNSAICPFPGAWRRWRGPWSQRKLNHLHGKKKRWPNRHRGCFKNRKSIIDDPKDSLRHFAEASDVVALVYWWPGRACRCRSPEISC